MRTKRYKPLFQKQELLWGDSVQEKQKKVAKMMFEGEMRTLEANLYRSSDIGETIKAFDIFRARIRRIVKKI